MLLGFLGKNKCNILFLYSIKYRFAHSLESPQRGSSPNEAVLMRTHNIKSKKTLNYYFKVVFEEGFIYIGAVT